MVSVEDTGLRGGGSSFKNQIWEAARPTIEAWTGMKLKPSSLYGIRIYTEGAILSPHVDRIPSVNGCIINVAQDVDEPWMLEVYDRHDRAVNVTLEPGDMVLYENGSVIHGVSFNESCRKPFYVSEGKITKSCLLFALCSIITASFSIERKLLCQHLYSLRTDRRALVRE